MKIALCLFVLAVLVSAGCVQSAGFSANYQNFKDALERNGANENVLLPPTLEQIRGLKIELSGLESAVQAQPDGTDKEASLALIDLENDLANMQENYFLGTEQTQLVNYIFPSCTPQSNLGRAIVFFDNAGKQADLAGKKSGIFSANYSGFASQTQIDFEKTKSLAEQSKGLFASLKQQTQQFCP